MSFDPFALTDCALARWSPVIGDPSPMGWATVAAYAAAAAVLLRRGLDGRAHGRERLFWLALAVLLAALAINKQLDLQSFLTALGRCQAQAAGWYGARRAAQAAFIAGLAAGCALVCVALVVLLRRSLRHVWLSLLGVTLLCAFVLIRAVGFHGVDALLGVTVAGWRANWALELGGIGLTALGALFARRSHREQRTDGSGVAGERGPVA